MKFSPSTKQFFPAELISVYTAAGTLPADVIDISAETFDEFVSTEKPAGKVVGADAAGTPVWVDSPLDPISDIAQRQRRMIDKALDAALAAGMAYTLPDGSDDVIQTRPDQDEANLLGLAIEARDLRTAGETGAVMSLRAKSNTVYSLTPEQMIALTDAAKEFKQALLAKSWQLKDAVSAVLEAGDRAALEAITWDTDSTDQPKN
ncbi:DUF4376 domain-containing protein [Salinicola socius]|uniref:DUF4376 domain-containing protein n=1 Tax=Salinicola socius TaxID=404433 RepID=A0A1Q8SPJ2_9GAMM|nr:DUF4376 domain-containing protein [Salinicola socius]OLO03335.1 hypothetical protein BTW07_14730 [Salinicola socius]